MDLQFEHVLIGLRTYFTLSNLTFSLIGVFVGTVVGVLPGLGAAATIALLLPFTFHMNEVSAIILLAGIWYGSMYGGSTTSILLRIPGEGASIMTCVDGYEMTRKGRAGAALGIAAIGSFVAGTLSVVGLMLFAPPLAGFALRFGPAEYFGLGVLGLSLVTRIASGSTLKAGLMAVAGLLLGTVGIDGISGTARLTFGSETLLTGLDVVPIAIGLFGIAEVFTLMQGKTVPESLGEPPRRFWDLLPSREEWRYSIPAVFRGTLVGFFLGAIPGGSATVSGFAAYAVEKRVSRQRALFGKGAIAGVAAPESANNSATGAGMIPLLSLGIPGNVITALMLGALMLHGIRPGPMLVSQRPDMFWGVIVSMYMGNVMLLILNLPLIGLFTRIALVPQHILTVSIVLVSVLGAYGVNNNSGDVLLAFLFGVVGYFLRRGGFEEAPLLLAFILGPIVETSLRQALILSEGSFQIFWTRPIAGALLAAAVLITVSSFVPRRAGGWRERLMPFRFSRRPAL